MDIILIILMFILGLLFLITIHEFGHFIFAKLFGVYCFEFSIGFGKKVIRRKKKYSETYFCIGVVPLGGYVAMFGEDDDECFCYVCFVLLLCCELGFRLTHLLSLSVACRKNQNKILTFSLLSFL